MKKIAVIGATGFVGSQVVKELASRGYQVNALARNVDKVELSDNVTAISVDVNDVEKLSEVLSGADAVISAYNAGWSNPNIYNDFMTGAKTIEKAVENSGVKRFIVVGGAGSLQADERTQIVDTADFPEVIKPGALAARDYLNEIKKNTTLDWSFFSPAPEMHQGTSGERKGTYRLGTDYPVADENGRSILSVEDVAVVLVDELENNQYIQKRFTAAY